MTDVHVLENDAFVEITVTDDADLTYDFDFRADAADTLVVSVVTAGVAVVLVYPDDFSVSGLGAENGGTITLDAGVTLTVGAKIRISRLTPVERVTDFTRLGSFSAERINEELDHQAMIAQEARRDIDRSLKPELGETDVAMGGGKLTGLGAGTAAGDAVNKAQLDAVEGKQAAFDYRLKGNPSDGLGVDGQTYLNVLNGDTYLKENGSWGIPGSLRGMIDSSNATVTNMIKVTQAAHDELDPPEPETVYLIVN